MSNTITITDELIADLAAVIAKDHFDVDSLARQTGGDAPSQYIHSQTDVRWDIDYKLRRIGAANDMIAAYLGYADEIEAAVGAAYRRIRDEKAGAK